MTKQTVIMLGSFFMLTGCTGTIPQLGVKSGKLTQCPQTSNCVNSQANDIEYFIDPILISAKPLEAKNYILTSLDELEVAKVAVVEDNYIRAEFASKLFRFVDDVEFYFPDNELGELLIHVRSASRVGNSDLGVNRKRIEKIRNKIKKIQKE